MTRLFTHEVDSFNFQDPIRLSCGCMIAGGNGFGLGAGGRGYIEDWMNVDLWCSFASYWFIENYVFGPLVECRQLHISKTATTKFGVRWHMVIIFFIYRKIINYYLLSTSPHSPNCIIITKLPAILTLLIIRHICNMSVLVDYFSDGGWRMASDVGGQITFYVDYFSDGSCQVDFSNGGLYKLKLISYSDFLNGGWQMVSDSGWHILVSFLLIPVFTW